MEILRFIEQRFRQGIQIPPQEIQTYYHEHAAAAIHRKAKRFRRSTRWRRALRRFCLQQRVNVLFDDWLENLRKQGDIEVLDPALESPVTQTSPQTSPQSETQPGADSGRLGSQGGGTNERARAHVGSGPDSGLPVAPEPSQPRKRSRLRRFFLRHVPLSLAALAILLAVAVVGVYFWASSSRGEAAIRERLVAWLEQATGGRVEIATFHWHLLDLEADAGGLVIHGLEAPGEAPYAQAESLRVKLTVLGFLSPRILLRELDVTRPAFHLIVYPDGTTNQPHPAQAAKA